MNKTTLSLLLSFLISHFVFSQNEIVISFTSNNQNSYIYNASPIKITNTQNVFIGGTFISDNYIKIIPNITDAIIIKPLNTNSKIQNPSGEPTTTIRPKPPGTTLPGISTAYVYPNPVKTFLNFEVTSDLVSSFSIYDTFGNLKITQIISPPTNTGTIDVASLVNDTYILVLNTKNYKQLPIQFIKN